MKWIRTLRPAAALSLAWGLAGCVTPGGNQPATERGAFGVPLDRVEVSGADYVKGESRIVIGAFRVAFSQSAKAASQRSALFSSGSASAAMSGKLRGLEPADYQAIADAAYADFIARLRAGGFAVIEPSALGAASAYARMAAVANPAALDSSATGDVLMVAPTGVKLALFPGESGVASGFAGFDANNPMRVLPELVKEQKAGVAQVTYYIDFLNTASSGNSLVAGGAAEVSMGQGLSVRAGSGVNYTTVRGSQCVGYCPNATTVVKLGQAVHSQEAYGTTRDVTNTAVNVIGAVSGLLSGRSFERKDIEVDADAARYRAIAGTLLGEANAALTGAMTRAR
ncbi:hypothetical protein PIGHUM_02609 [Pigmentiphaga humi]|uniref:Lipoprotein n=1 Tax=Pigmentiphaga humi TaxID=2478468 RepID=A0A3P4B2M0_9BURK|nr:hypothetical protein [Pigmentiphaga humi]VCU70537.1 hypothetical protein PIGHUM_02609 [Pigmentiphaga humi]